MKFKASVQTFLQKLFISVQLYIDNGLANHAAASAYGFLLSLAPMVLIIVLFVFYVFKPSQQAIASLVSGIPFLTSIFDDQWIAGNFLAASKPGISGIISVLSIFWAARILGLSIRRGLKVIFPAGKNRNPVLSTLVVVATDAAVLFFILVVIVSSRAALYLYRLLNVPDTIFAFKGFFSFMALGVVSFFAYLFVPANSPRRFSAFQGALFCSLAFCCTNMILEIILDRSALNFLYGTLGNLIVLLINVYFFFTFFFMGAQMASVTDSFDALLFLKIRQIRIRAEAKNNAEAPSGQMARPDFFTRFFSPSEGSLKKYLRSYHKNDIIISQGEAGDAIYYLIEGEVDIVLSVQQDMERSAGIMAAGSFFGEMGYLLSEDRSATIRAKTGVSVFVLPPPLFDTILRYDTSLNRDIIEHMSRRLKSATDQIITLKSEC